MMSWARFFVSSLTLLLLKLLTNEVFLALGLAAYVSYFITQVFVGIYSYLIHSYFTFRTPLSIAGFGRFLTTIVGFKVADYLIFNVAFYGGHANSVLSVLVATGLLWVVRYFAIKATLSPKPEPEGLRVSIIGGTIYGNRGAEAMLCTTIGKLREVYPRMRVDVFSYYPQQDRNLLAHDANTVVHNATPARLVLVLAPFALLGFLFRVCGARPLIQHLPREVSAVFDSTMLLDIAGVCFIDGREKFLPFNIMTLWPFFLAGVPVIKLAQATGPYRRPLNRLAAKLFLKRCRHVFARGERTYEHLADLSTNPAWRGRADDVAFCYQDSFSLSDENSAYVDHQVQRLTGGEIVGVCPSSLAGSDGFVGETSPYIDRIEMLVRALLQRGSQVVLFPNATREDVRALFRNNDLVVIDILKKRLAGFGGRLLMIDRDVNTRSIRRVITRCDLVIVSRFHAMVAALSLSVPCIVLGWSHKYVEVMDAFGLADQVFDYEKFAVDELMRLVENVLASHAAQVSAIEAAKPDVMARAQHQFDYVLVQLATYFKASDKSAVTSSTRPAETHLPDWG